MIESQNRNNTIEQNLMLWSEMINGDNTLTFRAKINMKHKQACMRDPILYRSCDVPHYKTGLKHKIYPSYDLSCPILDSIEGITNTFRTSEYSDRNDLYFWVLKRLGLREPKLQLFSSLSFEHTLLSKRKIKWFIENNYVDSWDDPRLCTIRGLLKRGITIQCILNYVENYYLSNITSKQGTYSLMITINNNILDKITNVKLVNILFNFDMIADLLLNQSCDSINKILIKHDEILNLHGNNDVVMLYKQIDKDCPEKYKSKLCEFYWCISNLDDNVIISINDKKQIQLKLIDIFITKINVINIDSEMYSYIHELNQKFYKRNTDIIMREWNKKLLQNAENANNIDNVSNSSEINEVC